MTMSWKQNVHVWMRLKLKLEMVLENPPLQVPDTEEEMMAEEIVGAEGSHQPLNAAQSGNAQYRH